MDPSAAGPAILFVVTLAATMIVGTFVFSYAAHCFLTVVEQTASGNDEVNWPRGPFIDWLWEVVYVLWLSALWLGPTVLLASSGVGGGASVLVAAALVWLAFPITLLSSMSSTSRWVIVSPGLLSRLLGQRSSSLLLFYLHNGPVLAAAAALLFLTFFKAGGLVFVLVTAAGFAAALLIYARQLGRLAHLLEHTREPAKPRPRRDGPRRLAQVRAAAYDPWNEERNRPQQPSDLPPVLSPMEGPILGYDVRFDDQPVPEPPPPPRKRPPDLDDVPYELVGKPNEAPPRGPMPKQWTEPSDYEMSLARGGMAPPPPKHPWAVGVYNFPLYSRTLPALVALTGGFTLLGILVAGLIAFKP
jgi:hypothetical protein